MPPTRGATTEALSPKRPACTSPFSTVPTDNFPKMLRVPRLLQLQRASFPNSASLHPPGTEPPKSPFMVPFVATRPDGDTRSLPTLGARLPLFRSCAFRFMAVVPLGPLCGTRFSDAPGWKPPRSRRTDPGAAGRLRSAMNAFNQPTSLFHPRRNSSRVPRRSSDDGPKVGWAQADDR